MQQSGEYQIPASREDVWQALNDADVLGACIPGCQRIDKIDNTHFDAEVKAKIGPVSALFRAELELADMVQPQSYVINGQAKGGAAGFGKGSASVVLAEQDGGTLLTYELDAKVGGKLAQVGSRLVDGAARKIADEFFGAFSARLGGAKQQTQDEVTEGEPSPESQPRYESSGHWLIWAIAFGVFVAAMLLAI